MARREIIVSEDDLTGGPATELVRFAIDKVSYEIDLNDDNAAAFRDALQPYSTHGRRTSSRDAKTTSGRSSKTSQRMEVRQ